MATGGSDVSTRVSTENNGICEIALSLFKTHKVEISDAIHKTFPFLEYLRDHGFITNEIYKDALQSYTKRYGVQEVIYDVLTELEKKFDLKILGALFSKVIMKQYPDLNNIYKIFQTAIPGLQLFPECEMEQRPEVQLSLEEGTAPPENRLAEPLHETELINGNETVPTTSDNNRALESQPANEQHPQESEPAGTTQHTNTSVNIHKEILPVTCGTASGMLIKRKLERGITVKCIRSDDGNWLSLREMEIRGGYRSANNWKNSVRCSGKPLRKLITEGILPTPPRATGRRKPQENSEKCKICQEEGKLFRCTNCFSFFHENCHLPPVESERKSWKCTFCSIQMPPRSHQHYKESEILGRQIGSDEMLKCEFILLKVYCHLENNVFLNIPHENYAEQASQCLKKLRKLDKIKKTLMEKKYRQVEEFVRAVKGILQDSECNASDLTREEFKKHFKEVFAIQTTCLSSSLL